MAANNFFEHGEPSGVLFYLLDQTCNRKYFHTADQAIKEWKPGLVIMVDGSGDPNTITPINAGRAT